MMAETNQIKNDLKAYIEHHFLAGKKITDLNYTTPLISSGLLDSISTMVLVSHIEKTFKIEFEPHEVDKENFENIDIIAQFIAQKL